MDEIIKEIEEHKDLLIEIAASFGSDPLFIPFMRLKGFWWDSVIDQIMPIDSIADRIFAFKFIQAGIIDDPCYSIVFFNVHLQGYSKPIKQWNIRILSEEPYSITQKKILDTFVTGLPTKVQMYVATKLTEPSFKALLDFGKEYISLSRISDRMGLNGGDSGDPELRRLEQNLVKRFLSTITKFAHITETFPTEKI